METKTKVIIGTVVVIAAFGSGYFAKPSKVDIQFKDREVIKEVVKTVKEVKTNIVTVVKEVKQPDGTTTTETRTEDRTQVVDNTQSNTNTERVSEGSKVTTNDIGLTIQALAVTNLSDFSNREYGVLVKKRIISNISGTVMATHKGTVGLGIGLDF